MSLCLTTSAPMCSGLKKVITALVLVSMSSDHLWWPWCEYCPLDSLIGHNPLNLLPLYIYYKMFLSLFFLYLLPGQSKYFCFAEHWSSLLLRLTRATLVKQSSPSPHCRMCDRGMARLFNHHAHLTPYRRGSRQMGRCRTRCSSPTAACRGRNLRLPKPKWMCNSMLFYPYHLRMA